MPVPGASVPNITGAGYTQSAEAANTRLRGLLERAETYLRDLSDNLMRNDADMRLDPCRDPEGLADEIQIALRETGE
jgi:hypothetical protein